ncbi:MAG: DNA-3-methyladenine glycosylase I [Aquihabitans sp.]
MTRCGWADSSPLMRDYHDLEWGRPIHDEAGLYERICLEGFQAGLSWATILKKRPAFRAAFADFDPELVARFCDDRVEALLGDSAIVRHRGKIVAARTNAQAVIALRGQEGLDELIWSFQPEAGPAPRTQAEVPTSSIESKNMAKALKARGFCFIGPTSAFALMEAIGMVNTHLADCHVRNG